MAKNRLKKDEKHEDKCACAVCGSGLPHDEAIARLRAWEDEMMAKHGWYAHMVGDHGESPTKFSAHTHGLEVVGKTNFEIVCPMDGSKANALLAALVERGKGEELSAGAELGGILRGGYKVRLALAEECGRKVLRVIMPDKDGRLGADADEPWSDQIKGCLPVG